MNRQTIKQRDLLNDFSGTLRARARLVTEASRKFERNNNLLGYVGMLFVHTALMPNLLGVLQGTMATPQIYIPLGVFVGLIFYEIRAIRQRDWVYIISNGLGLTTNGLMLFLIAINY